MAEALDTPDAPETTPAKVGGVKRIIRALVGFFTEPVSPYKPINEGFRNKLKETDSTSVFSKLAEHLEKRYGLRANSMGNTVILLSVVLTSGFVFFDTLCDTLISVDAWARPMFLPAVWTGMIALWFLIQAVKAAKDEVNPKAKYSGDEIEQALQAVYGNTDPKLEEGLPEPKVVLARLTEVASRTSHDRGALWLRRYYLNRSLNTAFVGVALFVLALSVYAIVGVWL